MNKPITASMQNDIQKDNKVEIKLQSGNETEISNTDVNTDVTPEENELLEQSVNHMGSKDDADQQRATLDKTDDNGELLNEETDFSGDDLDVPGSEYDDENEELGGEDEENNSYSLGADKKD